MIKVDGFPMMPYAKQGLAGPNVSLKDHVLSLVEDMLARPDVVITEHNIEVDGVLWVDEITIKFPVETANV